MLNAEQLQAIRERCEKASKAPWTEELDGSNSRVKDGDGYHVDSADEDGVALWEKDATFIAHARQDIPALLAHIAELESKLEDYKNRWSSVPTLYSLKLAEREERERVIGILEGMEVPTPYGGSDEGHGYNQAIQDVINAIKAL